MPVGQCTTSQNLESDGTLLLLLSPSLLHAEGYEILEFSPLQTLPGHDVIGRHVTPSKVETVNYPMLVGHMVSDRCCASLFP